jgi:metal-sulfur cluster biosynthetic enzyme
MVTETDLINSYKTVFDPEVSVNIYDLGLIYEINIDEGASKRSYDFDKSVLPGW